MNNLKVINKRLIFGIWSILFLVSFIGVASAVTYISTDDVYTGFSWEDYKNYSTSWSEYAGNLFFNGGNVGIGTSSPQAKLDVDGLITTDQVTTFSDPLVSAVAGGDRYEMFYPGLYKLATGMNANARMWFQSNSGTNGGFGFWTGTNDGNLAERFVIDGDGNVGIGTTTPQNLLDISGASVIGSTYAGTNTAPTDGLLVEGNVGIGTSTPQNLLNVLGDGNFTENLYVGGNLSFANPYGMFSSNESQIVTVAGTVYTMNFSHVEDTHMMSLDTNNENITIQSSGDYALTLSGLFETDSNNKHFEIFPRINGVNIPRSNTLIEIENAGTHGLIAVDFILDLDLGDVVTIHYSSDDAGSMTVWTAGHGAGADEVPETPSMILTLAKISEITS